jgi:hypothetical protein
MRKCVVNASARQLINFDNICEIIQASDGFSRHLETYLPYKLVKMTQEGIYKKIFFFLSNLHPTGKMQKSAYPQKSHLCKTLQGNKLSGQTEQNVP